MNSSKLKYPAMLLLIGLAVASCKSGIEPEQIEAETRMDSISYIIGYDYGAGIREQEINANPLLVYKGIFDALNNDSTYFDDSTRMRLIRNFQNELEEKEEKRFQEMLAENKRKGQQFLKINREREGVEVLPNGLQYKILKVGKGDFPSPTDSVTIHYRAMYIDRTTFDMSYETGPVGIRVDEVIKGLSQGIQLMRKGAIYEFYIPPQLAYGDENYRDLIPAGSTIIYIVELIEIHDT